MTTRAAGSDTVGGMPTTTAADERALVDALRRGDERAFVELVDRHHALMVRVARGYVRSDALAGTR